MQLFCKKHEKAISFACTPILHLPMRHVFTTSRFRVAANVFLRWLQVFFLFTPSFNGMINYQLATVPSALTSLWYPALQLSMFTEISDEHLYNTMIANIHHACIGADEPANTWNMVSPFLPCIHSNPTRWIEYVWKQK